METEVYLAICKLHGFTLSELKELTVGFALDVAIEIVELKKPADEKEQKQGTIRRATQADFDNF